MITFLMEYENATFPEALKTLADRVGIRLPERAATKEEREAADLKSALLEVNKEAARYSGINTRWIEFSVYVISGLCAGICGFLMASRISSGNANSADGYEMTAISAAVIGGVSLSGGVGTMYGAMIGVLIVGVISNGMDILGINTYFQSHLHILKHRFHMGNTVKPCINTFSGYNRRKTFQ